MWSGICYGKKIRRTLQSRDWDLPSTVSREREGTGLLTKELTDFNEGAECGKSDMHLHPCKGICARSMYYSWQDGAGDFLLVLLKAKYK
jgi:hypothetical protein